MTVSTAAAKTTALKRIREALDRALALHERVVVLGGTSPGSAGFVPFRNTDKRDLTVFVFFEVAAAFEYFSEQAFMLCIRERYSIPAGRAVYVGGDIDQGLRGLGSWANPCKIQLRARAVFGKQHFLSGLKENLPERYYDWLFYAYAVRNRIAHPSAKAKAELNKLLGVLRVPKKSRKGLSTGRLLAEYPPSALATDRWFHRFLAAYASYVDLIEREL